MTAQAPDPADTGADQFTAAPTARRTGGMTLEQWIDWFTRKPDATAPSGVAGMLTQEIHRLRADVSLLKSALQSPNPETTP